MNLKKEIIFWGTVTDGRLKLANTEFFKEYVGKMEGLVSLRVKSHKKKRTSPQLNLYWLWITFLANEMGYDRPEDLHEYLKDRFNSEIKFITGKDGRVREVKIIHSTSEMDISEFSKYMEKVVRFAGEEGINLPDPEKF